MAAHPAEPPVCTELDELAKPQTLCLQTLPCPACTMPSYPAAVGSSSPPTLQHCLSAKQNQVGKHSATNVVWPPGVPFNAADAGLRAGQLFTAGEEWYFTTLLLNQASTIVLHDPMK